MNEMNSKKSVKLDDIFFWIATGVLTALAFVYSGFFFPVEVVPVTFPRETIFFTLSAAAIAFSTLRGGPVLSKDKKMAFWLLVAFVLWSVIATLWAANTAGHSRRLVELVFFAGWAFALSNLAVPEKRTWVITWVLGFGGGFVGAAVASGWIVLGTSLAAWPFGNANAAGMFCTFALIINAGLLIESLRSHKPKDPEVVLTGLSTLFAVSGLIAARSKGALLGLIVGTVVMLWQLFPRKRKWIAIAAAVVLAVSTSIYVARAHRESGGKLADTTSGFRVSAYKAAIKQIAGAPMGRGLGSFYAYFPRYALPAISGHPKMGDTAFHAHSNILEIGTEIGVVGMLIFIAFSFYIGILPLVAKTPADTRKWRLQAIWLGAFAAISAHALVAVHFYWTETVVYFWTAAGILLALGREGKPRVLVKKRIAFAAVVVVALAGLWYVGVWDELRGRRYVAAREKKLKFVRKLDKEYSRKANTPQAKTPEFEQLQRRRYSTYARIIAELYAELGLVHDQRMLTDTYYQLGSAYYNTNRPKHALDFFNALIKVAPGYVNTEYFIGRSYAAVAKKVEGRAKDVRRRAEAAKYQAEAAKLYAESLKWLDSYLKYNPRAKMSKEAKNFRRNVQQRLKGLNRKRPPQR